MPQSILRHFCLIAMTVALGACAPSREGSDFDPARVEAEVRAAMDALETADRNLDAEGVISLLSPDFYTYQDGVRAEREAVVTQIRQTLPTLRSFETEFENVAVIVLGPDAALVSMTFWDRITDAEGTVTQARGPSTFLWRRTDGAWAIAYLDADHYPDSADS